MRLLLLLLLLVPVAALAQQPTYDLTCEDVFGRIDALTNELKVVEAREAE